MIEPMVLVLRMELAATLVIANEVVVAFVVVAFARTVVPVTVSAPEIAKLVVVAFVDVAFPITRFVIVDDALLTRMPSVEVSGCRYAPWSVQFEDPLPMHVSLIAKQPPVKFNPTFDVDVEEPEMVRPESVVVPKPSPATDKNFVAFDVDATSKSGLVCGTMA